MLIIGLGNIGKQYQGTYHNVGFLVVDRLLELLEQKTNAKICDAESVAFYRDGEKVIIAKPTTFMNLSGKAAKGLMSYHRIKPEDTLIVYDDFDLPLGAVRLRKSGSGGTHNGMKNVVSELGTTEIPRMRIGIGQPDKPYESIADYVLSHISAERMENLKPAIDKAAKGIAELLDGKEFDKVTEWLTKG